MPVPRNNDYEVSAPSVEELEEVVRLRFRAELARLVKEVAREWGSSQLCRRRRERAFDFQARYRHEGMQANRVVRQARDLLAGKVEVAHNL